MNRYPGSPSSEFDQAPEEPKCKFCETVIYPSDEECCGGCGFTWEELDKAEKIVQGLIKVFSADFRNSNQIPHSHLHAAMDFVLGEIT